MSHDGEYKFDDPWITGLVKELQAENEQLRAQLAAVPVDRIATLTELALRNDDESVQLAGKIIVGWLYEWKVQP